MKVILSTTGKVIHCDDEDFCLLTRYNWNISREGYARTLIQNKPIFMHRLVMGVTPSGKSIIDHKDRNSLNNCRSNLRWTDKKGNSANTFPRGPYGYKGVRKTKNQKKGFTAYITVNGKQISLGSHKTAEEAAAAYNEAAIKHFGEFAGLNIL